VIFTGQVTELADYYNGVDIVVNASIGAETFGLTIAEALLMEKLVVAPDLGGPLEILESIPVRFVFHSGSASSLALKLKESMHYHCQLHSDCSHYLQDLRKGRQHIIDHYGVWKSTTDIESIYKYALFKF
jgi:glycosyltransferase involved in cell wall biosynthesis